MAREAERFSYAELAAFVGPVSARRGFCHNTETDATAMILAEHAGVTRRTVFRWAHSGLTEAAADNVACALGVHPSAIWAQWTCVDA